VAQLVAAGELAVCLTTYSGNADSIKAKGGPIDWVAVDPLVGRPQAIAVAKNAPHPHAALLFQDFILTDGQKILAERESVPTNPKVKAAPDGLIFVDLPRFMDEGSRWTRLFRETFTVR